MEPTDQPTNGWMDKARCRVTCMRLKTCHKQFTNGKWWHWWLQKKVFGPPNPWLHFEWITSYAIAAFWSQWCHWPLVEGEVTWCWRPFSIMIFGPYVRHVTNRLHFQLQLNSCNTLKVITIILIIIKPSEGDSLFYHFLFQLNCLSDFHKLLRVAMT